MQVDHKQPFYSVLPDEHDCLRIFKGGRTTKYVAQVGCIVPSPPHHTAQWTRASAFEFASSCMLLQQYMQITCRV